MAWDAWHDHSAASRRVHGTAYATHIGCSRKHVWVVMGQRTIASEAMMSIPSEEAFQVNRSIQ
jgi:hypothetical protein